jgi:hypothetical protein
MTTSSDFPANLWPFLCFYQSSSILYPSPVSSPTLSIHIIHTCYCSSNYMLLQHFQIKQENPETDIHFILQALSLSRLSLTKNPNAEGHDSFTFANSQGTTFFTILLFLQSKHLKTSTFPKKHISRACHRGGLSKEHQVNYGAHHDLHLPHTMPST